MAANVIQYNYVSRDAQVALEEFRADFQGAFIQDDSEQWARELGLEIQTNALKVTLPVPISAAGYVERKGDRIYRRLSEKSFSFSPRIWHDGFAEFAEIVEAPDFLGFQQEPANMAAAAAQLINELVSAQLELNPTLTGWDNLTFFHDTHPNHVVRGASSGTFDNDITGAGTDLTAINIGKARQSFRKIKGPNGKPAGIRFWGILIPGAQEEQARRLQQQSTIIQAGASSSQFGPVENIYKGLNYRVSDQLTDDNKWYAIGIKRGMYPWSVVNRGAPESQVLDKNSALFETQSKVGFQSTLQAEAALCFPQLMQRWAGTAP